MDLVSMALTYLLQNPQVAVDAAKHLSRPGAVNVQQMGESFADLSRGVLGCYHPSATYRYADLVRRPWARQSQYAAQDSAVIRIHYSGVSGTPYQMLVAVMAKDQSVRAAVLGDTALVPYSKRCQLENWVDKRG